MTRRPHRLWPSPRSVAFSLALLALATWPSAQAEPRPNWINVKDYIEKRHIKKWQWRLLPDRFFHWLEHRLGWHLCITARKRERKP